MAAGIKPAPTPVDLVNRIQPPLRNPQKQRRFTRSHFPPKPSQIDVIWQRTNAQEGERFQGASAGRSYASLMKLARLAVAIALVFAGLSTAARANGNDHRALYRAVIDSSLAADPRRATNAPFVDAYRKIVACNTGGKLTPRADTPVTYRTNVTLYRHGGSFTVDSSDLSDLISQSGTGIYNIESGVPWPTCGNVDLSGLNPKLPPSISIDVDNVDALSDLHISRTALGQAESYTIPIDVAGRIVAVDANDPTHYYARIVITGLAAHDPERAHRMLARWSATSAYRPPTKPVSCELRNAWTTAEAGDGLAYAHADMDFTANESLILAPSEFVVRLQSDAGALSIPGYDAVAPPYINAAHSFLPLLLDDPSMIQHTKFQVDIKKDMGFVRYLTMRRGDEAHWTISFQIPKSVDVRRIGSVSWGNAVECNDHR